MKIKDAEKWVKALRSGKYEQGTKYLCYSGKYCCLGVLDDIFPKMKLSYDESCHVICNADLPGFRNIGLSDSIGGLPKVSHIALAELNDGKTVYGDFNFDEIADIIQAIYVEKVL